MKLLLYAFLSVTIIIISCKPKEQKVPPHVEVKKHLIDVEVLNPQKDMETEGEIMTRKGGKGQGHGKPPKDTVPTPPPPIPPPAGAYLMLDFDGDVVVSSSWNLGTPITCEPSGVSAANQLIILEQVKKYYSTFSTVKVGTSQSEYDSYPTNKRMKCIITASYQWYAPNGGIGGVANINSFNWYSDDPCFVFSTLVGVDNIRMLMDDIAHELGHTFGCRHQATCDSMGNIISGYNYGDQYTAPIMGASFYSDTALWWIGATSLGCSVIQNDTAVIFTSLRK